MVVVIGDERESYKLSFPGGGGFLGGDCDKGDVEMVLTEYTCTAAFPSTTTNRDKHNIASSSTTTNRVQQDKLSSCSSYGVVT